MNFQNSIKTCFKKYATFSGRASRSEFWYFYLFTYAIFAILIISGINIASIFFWFLGGFFLVTFVPFIAVIARRLHDVNKSGWFQILPLPFQALSRVPNDIIAILFSLITLGLYIYLLVLWCSKGDKKNNRFGKSINLRKKG